MQSYELMSGHRIPGLDTEIVEDALRRFRDLAPGPIGLFHDAEMDAMARVLAVAMARIAHRAVVEQAILEARKRAAGHIARVS